MFSGLIRRTIRTIIISLLALAGLIMLYIPIVRADNAVTAQNLQADSVAASLKPRISGDENAENTDSPVENEQLHSTPVLSVYITNAGAKLTYGTDDSNKPLYQTSLNTWDNAVLYGHPPNVVYNDSPLIFFRQLVKKAAPSLKELIEDNPQPLQVYIGAAGADEERTFLPSDADGAKKRLADKVKTLLIGDKQKKCLTNSGSRLEFFACTFKQEILENIIGSGDNQEAVSLKLEQDKELITTMASIYSGEINTDASSIVVHSTTLSLPYLVKNGKAPELKEWKLEAFQNTGGIYQLGALFKAHMKTLEQEDKIESDPLLSVVTQDQLTTYHPDGAAANMKRLKFGKGGYNNFGHIVGNISNGLNSDRVTQEIDDRTYQEARNKAQQMLEHTRNDFIALAVSCYALAQKKFDDKWRPRLIIVGEEAQTMFASQEIFSEAATTLSEKKPGMLINKIHNRQDLKDPNTLKQWLTNKGLPFVRGVMILPVNQFSQFQHQAAVLKMSSQLQATDQGSCP